MSQSNGRDNMGPIQFVNETDTIIGDTLGNGGGLGFAALKRPHDFSDSDSEGGHSAMLADTSGPKPGKKTKGRVKIKMEFIENKLRRYTTFSKRKTGIMKKAYELSTLTGTQVMLLVASETGHVYTFATRKLQPMITSDSGKALIQTCLNSPDNPPLAPGQSSDDQRMNPTGFEEPELSYGPVSEEDAPSPIKADLVRGVQYMQQTPPTPEPQPQPLQQQQQTTGVVGSRQASPAPARATPSPATQQPIPAHQTPGTAQQQRTPAQVTIPMTTYISQPVTTPTTAATSSNKPPSLPMQLPTGGIIFPQSALPPGTPIAFSPAPFTPTVTQAQSQAQQLQTMTAPTQQAVYRIPTPAPGQVVSLPGFPAQTATSLAGGRASGGQSQVVSTTGTTSMAMPQPIAVLSGTPSSAGGGQTGTIMYQTPQGVVYASTGALPEGYNLILPQTPTLNMTQDQQQGGGTPQYITIPVPVSSFTSANTQMFQSMFSQPETTNVTPTDLSQAAAGKTHK